jgi:hypothetical protein
LEKRVRDQLDLFVSPLGRVLVLRSRLSFAPIAFENLLASVDETARVRGRTVADRIRGHEFSMSSSDHVE